MTSLHSDFIFYTPVLLAAATNPSFLCFHFFSLSSLSHFDHIPPSFADFSPLVPGRSVKQGCSFTLFPYSTSCLLSIPKTTLFFHYLYSSYFSVSFPSFSPVAFFYLLPTLYPTVFPAMFPYCLSPPILSPSLLSISFPSLPLPQIWFDSHSLPGLNHQDLLEGPNHRPVSPQRGFCLLTVETNDLHALCLWSVPRHLEAVEVITVICLTRRRLHTVSASPLAADGQGCSVFAVTAAVV